MRSIFRVGLLIAAVFCARADIKNQDFSDFTTPLPLKKGDTLVIGVVGGWESWHNPNHMVRGTVLRIRERKLPGVYAESVENHKLDLGRELAFKALDRNRNGKIDEEEASSARIIIFGQSLGGPATLRLARYLENLGVPVLLTVQVDSVGPDDNVVPRNVRAAANMYQQDWLLQGERKIKAADPSATHIIGNFRYRYRGKNARKVQFPEDETTLRKMFLNTHLQMEYDRGVWDHLDRLVMEAIHSGDRRLARH
jgi:hypothetical protein